MVWKKKKKKWGQIKWCDIAFVGAVCKKFSSEHLQDEDRTVRNPLLEPKGLPITSIHYPLQND